MDDCDWSHRWVRGGWFGELNGHAVFAMKTFDAAMEMLPTELPVKKQLARPVVTRKIGYSSSNIHKIIV